MYVGRILILICRLYVGVIRKTYGVNFLPLSAKNIDTHKLDKQACILLDKVLKVLIELDQFNVSAYVVLVLSSVSKVSDWGSLILIVCFPVQPKAECATIVYSMRVRIAQVMVAPIVGYNKPFDPGLWPQYVLCEVCWGRIELQVRKA